jgi:spermidine synthase
MNKILPAAASGAEIFGLSLVTLKFLTPFFGSGMFLLQSLLISAGVAYAAGVITGSFRKPRPGMIGRALGAAGIWTLLLPFLFHPVLDYLSGYGMRNAVLLGGMVFTVPPIFISGVVIALSIRNRGNDGLGSILAPIGIHLASGVIVFVLLRNVLMPLNGIAGPTMALGLSILAAGTLAEGWIVSRSIRFGLSVILLGGAVILCPGFASLIPRNPDIIAIRQTPSGEIRVVRMTGMRFLLIDGAVAGSADTATWESGLHYAAAMDIPKLFYAKPGTALLAGLGSGSVLKQYSRERWLIECVEPNADVTAAAEEYFNLHASEGRVVTDDPGHFLDTTTRRYQLILVDPVAGPGLRPRVLTQEMVDRVHAHLETGGIAAVSVVVNGWNDPLAANCASLLKKKFAHVIIYPVEEPPNRPGAVVIMASDSSQIPQRDPGRNDSFDPDWRYGPGYQKAHAWDNRFISSITRFGSPGDERSEIRRLGDEADIAMRKEWHALFGQGGIGW